MVMSSDTFDLAQRVIRRAHWIIEPPAHWIHGKTAVDENGRPCRYGSSDALRWNGDGALCKAAGEIHPSSPAVAYRAACDLLGQIPKWPGEAARPDHQGILAFFNAALALTFEQI